MTHSHWLQSRLTDPYILGKTFLKVFGGHMSFFWGHWYPCFGFLVTSPLGIFVEANVMHISQDPPLVLHVPTSWQPARSWSLPHMHVQRWDLAWIPTGNHQDRRRTRYHCFWKNFIVFMGERYIIWTRYTIYATYITFYERLQFSFHNSGI